MQMKDGSILVSDDWNGAVYRVTYGKEGRGAVVARQVPSLRAERKQSRVREIWIPGSSLRSLRQ